MRLKALFVSLTMMSLTAPALAQPTGDPTRGVGRKPEGATTSAVGGTPAKSLKEARLGDDLQVKQIADGVWLHVSWKALPGVGLYPSNGLLVLTPHSILMIDTPWNDDQTRRLMQWAASSLGAKVHDLIVTHAHDDRMGGIGPASAAGVETWSVELTAGLARKAGYPLPGHAFGVDAALEFGGERIEVLYPGAAHAPDNIVVWFPKRQILFGGCMVKAADANDLGNLADANVESWNSAIALVKARFPGAKLVVPGHGNPGGRDILEHTASLVAQELQKSK
jgi:metallo-beta-lactamase class B